jgi:hypothetical protein
MAQNKESSAGQSAAGIGPMDMAAQAESFGRFQTELFEKVQEINRHWMDRVQSEMTAATELASKMTATRSMSDAAAICQEWAGQRMKRGVEDTEYAFAAGRRLMETGASLMQGKGKGAIGST